VGDDRARKRLPVRARAEPIVDGQGDVLIASRLLPLRLVSLSKHSWTP
jgi:hypothetical protein